jgi:succinate-acetate transporter protein
MSEQQTPTSWPTTPISIATADPAPLGLAGFALTTFILSAHNANWAPDLIWVG